jgi:cytidyltransferase-like protein
MPARVYVDMVADLLHAGHVSFLHAAVKVGEEESSDGKVELLVGIHSDETVASYKRKPICTMDERIAVVRALRAVDRVIPCAPLRVTKAYIEEHRIDMVVHGDDLAASNVDMMYGEAVALGQFRVVPYTSGISTTRIMSRVGRRLSTGEGQPPSSNGDWAPSPDVETSRAQ